MIHRLAAILFNIWWQYLSRQSKRKLTETKWRVFVFFGENLGSKVLGIYFIRGLSDTLLLFSSIHQSANLNFDIYFKQRPKLSEQSLPHQWRFIYNWNNLRLQNVQNSESESQKVKVATFTRKWKWPLSPRNTWRIYCEKNVASSLTSCVSSQCQASPLQPLSGLPSSLTKLEDGPRRISS